MGQQCCMREEYFQENECNFPYKNKHINKGREDPINDIDNKNLFKKIQMDIELGQNSEMEIVKPMFESKKPDIISELQNKLNTNVTESNEEDFKKLINEKYRCYPDLIPFISGELKGEKDLIEEKPVKLSDGKIYWGNWNKDYQMEGPGRLYLSDEHVYVEGLWKNGIIYKGRIIDNDGIYEGELNNSLPNGNGKMKYNSGNFYEGEFYNGLKEGIGCLKFSDNSKYLGEFKEDIIEGKGKFTWNNGYEYEGDFVKGYFEGKGILKGPNGSKYEGEFKKGVYHGKGKFTYGNINESYDGNYLFGKKDGHGLYKFKDGSLYEGNFKDNKPHGNGRVETANKIYKGLWRSGKNAEDPYISIKPGITNLTENYNLDLVTQIEDIDYSNLTNLNFGTSKLNKNENYKKNNVNLLVSKENLKESLFGDLK